MEKVPEFKLEFDGDRWSVNINSTTGAVILQKKNEPLLYKFSLNQDGSYKNEWRRQIPENKHWKSCCLTDAADIVLQDSNNRTCLFDKDLKMIDTWEYSGDLIACLRGLRTAYCVNSNSNKDFQLYDIAIRRVDGKVIQLQEGSNSRSKKSLCENATTEKLVVIDTIDRLRIFSQDGKSQHIV